MGKYELLDPAVEVYGETVRALVDALPDDPRSRRILASHGIENPNLDGWYPEEALLAACEEVYDTMGKQTLEQAGRLMVKQTEWPPCTDTVIDGIELVNAAYQMNHRGGDVGRYRPKRADDTRIHIVCDNPYPCPFDVGVIKGVIDTVRDTRVSIREPDTQCQKREKERCLYEIECADSTSFQERRARTRTIC